MNWDRDLTNQSRFNVTPKGIVPYSNIRTSYGEVLLTAPLTVQCRDMIEANRLVLDFYRKSCRLMPSLINRHSHNVFNDYHTSKLNLAKWIRVNENMRNPEDISNSIGRAYEFLFECVGDYYEDGFYMKYFNETPQNLKNTFTTGSHKIYGLNQIDQKRFMNKTSFLKKFIKGAKPLLK